MLYLYFFIRLRIARGRMPQFLAFFARSGAFAKTHPTLSQRSAEFPPPTKSSRWSEPIPPLRMHRIVEEEKLFGRLVDSGGTVRLRGEGRATGPPKSFPG